MKQEQPRDLAAYLVRNLLSPLSAHRIATDASNPVSEPITDYRPNLHAAFVWY